MANHDKSETTTTPVELGKFEQVMPEFGRIPDVTRVYGIKRGTLYNLIKDRKIKSCLLRVRGEKSGLRLIDMASVRAYIQSQMEVV